jgi:taurine dioxygenase
MTFTITPLPQALGAVVEGLDLSAGPAAVTDDVAERLHGAWLDNLVLFFPGLRLDADTQIALGERFGRLAATPTADDDFREQETFGPDGEVLVLDCSRPQDRANAWHTDVTFTPDFPKGSLLSMQVCPDKGGDTLWSNQYAAYEGLSPAVRDFVDGLEARHGRAGITGITTHPVVRVHPETGRRALFVNRGWTTGMVGLTAIEARNVLNMLFEHCERPEYTVRWHWHEGDAALWDNRATMHYAVDDYGDAARVIHRVTIHDA